MLPQNGVQKTDLTVSTTGFSFELTNLASAISNLEEVEHNKGRFSNEKY